MWKPNSKDYRIWYYKNPGHYHYFIFNGPVAHSGDKMITVYIKNSSWSDLLSTYEDHVMGLAGFTFGNKCNLSIMLR